MTSQEAIKQLIEIGNVLQIMPDTPKGQALLMAIQALKEKEGRK